MKALAHMLGVFKPFGNEAGYNLAVAQNHAQKVVKVGNKVVKGSVWKGKHKLKGCETYVPKEGSEGMKHCGEPITHVVSHEIDRWYGKKHAENGYCEKHAKEAVESLKNVTWTLAGGEKPNFEPVEIRKLK